MALCVVQIIHVRSLTHDRTALPVQVRLAYPVDSLGATGRNKCPCPDRLLFSGAAPVSGAVETLAAAHMDAAPTDLLLPSDECTGLL